MPKFRKERNDLTAFEATHRALHSLSRNVRLSQLNQARGYQLLEIVHYHLDSTPAGRARAIEDFTNSARLFPSRQSDAWLLSLQGFTLGPANKPDLWDESVGDFRF